MTEHPWPLVDYIAVARANQLIREAQRRSDWQHAWAQASAELREELQFWVLRSPSQNETVLEELADGWEQRAKGHL